jgi:hypothetical protein
MAYQLWMIIIVVIVLIAAITTLLVWFLTRRLKKPEKAKYSVQEQVKPGSLPHPYFRMDSVCPTCGNDTFQLVYGSNLQCAKCHHKYDPKGLD